VRGLPTREWSKLVRIGLVGGIFGKPEKYREVVATTPETMLAAGLRERGHDVTVRGHFGPFDFNNVDVLHVHHLAYGAVAAASSHADVPFVFTSHWFRQRSRSRRLAMRYVMSRADASVVLSETEATWQRRTYPFASARQHVIPNGIDETAFAYSPPLERQSDEPWRVLYVGQLSRFKGVNFLLRAIAMLDPNLSVELGLAYHVDSEEQQLRREAAALGLKGVQFLGARSPVQLAELYARSHLFVLPSTAEALPSVVSEALLVGRPVVATDVGAVKEQVGSFGRIIAPRDSSALAAAISEVLGNYEHFAARSRAASREAMRRYSVTAMVDAHERLYEELVHDARRAPLGRALLDAPLRAGLPLLFQLRRPRVRLHRWYGRRPGATLRCERD
jgi:glycosyltransferase involved in cell wall biosynthesis